MKKLFAICSMAAMVMLGVASCDKANPEGSKNPAGEGSVIVGLDFDKASTKAFTPSTGKPLTSWASVGEVLFMLVDNAGKVVDARTLTTPATGAAPAVQTFNNIPAGTYTGYMLSNFNHTKLTKTWSPANVKNQMLSALALTLLAEGYPPLGTETGQGYALAPDVFTARVPGVVVTANTTTDISTTKPFLLTRANSLFRVRISLESVANKTIDFTGADASVRIRRANTTITPSYNATAWSTASGGSDLTVAYATGYLTDAPASGYNSALKTAYLDPQQVAWKDVSIFPGGTALDNDNSKKFDVVVGGKTKDGNYIPLGKTTAVPQGTPIFWKAQVLGAVQANEIIEVNLRLQTNGFGGEDIIDPQATGTLTIKASFVDWGNILTTDIIV